MLYSNGRKKGIIMKYHTVEKIGLYGHVVIADENDRWLGRANSLEDAELIVKALNAYCGEGK